VVKIVLKPRKLDSYRILLIAALLAAAMVWQSGSAGAAEGPIIAVLNVEHVLRQSKAGLSLRSQIEQVRSNNQAKDRAAEEALFAEDQKLQAQRAVLSEEAFASKRKELQSQLDSQRREFEARRKRFQSAVNEAWFQIRAAMLEVTGGLVEEREIDVVITQDSTALISRDLNITMDVLSRLDEKLTEVTLTIASE